MTTTTAMGGPSQTNSDELPILAALVEEYPEFARKTYEEFFQFTWRVFARSFEDWVPGAWIKRRCEFLQSSPKTCVIGPRNHFKSTGFYAYFMWKLWRAGFDALGPEWAESAESFEAHYFSYKESSAGYHIGQGADSIRALIERNPLFGDLADLKPRAETKKKWTWNGEDEISIVPHGMRSHARGIHARLVFVDDPFQDPKNDLNPESILKINNVFKSTVASIPKTDADDELHVTTTPQTREDFVFDEELLSDYAHLIQPAIDESGAVLWPEWMDREALEAKKREIGRKLFNQEYQCSPKSAEVAFFSPEEIGEMVVPALPDWGADRAIAVGEWTKDPRTSKDERSESFGSETPAGLAEWLANDTMTGVVGGLDVGKKRHPSHLAVFAILRRVTSDGSELAGHLVQLHQRWMDSWDYTRQIDYCRRVIGMFGIDVLAYDATRGEFDGLAERGELPSQMEGVTLSSSEKNAMAGALDAAVSSDRLKLLPDDRQRRQLGVVTNNLDAVETAEGHGEPFTSTVWRSERRTSSRGDDGCIRWRRNHSEKSILRQFGDRVARKLWSGEVVESDERTEQSAASRSVVRDRGFGRSSGWSPTDASVPAVASKAQSAEPADERRGRVPEHIASPKKGRERSFDPFSLRQLARSESVQVAMNALMGDIESSSWRIVPVDEDASPSRQLIEDATAALRDLNPNPESFDDVNAMFARELLTVGNCAGVTNMNIEGRRAEVVPYDAATFTVDWDEHRILRGFYQYPHEGANGTMGGLSSGGEPSGARRGTGELRSSGAWGDPIPFDGEDVLWGIYNPTIGRGGFYGDSPVEMVIRQINVMGGLLEKETAELEEGMPSGLISLVGEEWSRENYENFESYWNNEVKGNQAKHPVAEGKAEFVPFDMSYQELQVLDRQRWYSKLVSAAFRIPITETGLAVGSETVSEVPIWC